MNRAKRFAKHTVDRCYHCVIRSLYFLLFLLEKANGVERRTTAAIKLYVFMFGHRFFMAPFDKSPATRILKPNIQGLRQLVLKALSCDLRCQGGTPDGVVSQ